MESVRKYLKDKRILLLISILIIAGISLIWFFPQKAIAPVEIANFDECEKAGNPVAESYPATCRADGKVFTQDIGNELEKQDLIRVDSPRPGTKVSIPLKISGEARGNWFFEANFTIRLVDANENEIGITNAQADGEWMTEEFVPFTAELEFKSPDTDKGTLILEKANPSGLGENADELRIPVKFEKSLASRDISLFFYNQNADPSRSCESFSVQSVSRSIPISKTPIQDTIKLLLKGDLTQEEKNKGFTSEFPLEGVELKGVVLRDGVLTLEFIDPANRTGGGSCRVGLLRSQIEKSAMQFPEVSEVRITPENLFQP